MYPVIAQHEWRYYSYRWVSIKIDFGNFNSLHGFLRRIYLINGVFWSQIKAIQDPSSTSCTQSGSNESGYSCVISSGSTHKTSIGPMLCTLQQGCVVYKTISSSFGVGLTDHPPQAYFLWTFSFCTVLCLFLVWFDLFFSADHTCKHSIYGYNIKTYSHHT